MGKKGSWFSAIKRVFTPHSKERLGDEAEAKRSKDRKKKGIGRLRHGESNSFIPLFREPSSIEKILGEAEREHNLVLRPLTPLEQPRTPTFVPATNKPASPKSSSSRSASALPRAPTPTTTANVSPQVPLPGAATLSEPPPVRSTPQKPSPPPPQALAPPRAASPKSIRYHRPEPTLRNQHASATKIQAAYRGYMARRGFRALKGLVRLQGVIRGQNVKRQTTKAMKHMQLLVRVQSQIQSRRIQMLENQALRQAQHRTDKEVESTLSKWTFGQSEAGQNENWDDSTLTKEEIDARMQRKMEALMKRERAMAYAYSHQLWKGSPRSVPTLFDIRSGGFPWWWNWLDRQLPLVTPSESQGMKNTQLTPPRPGSETYKPSPRPNLSSKHNNFGFEVDASTPLSTKSSFLPATKPAQTPPPPFRTPLATTSGLSKYSRHRASGAASPMDLPLKDDDSLTSCPAFLAPSYMAPTVSAKAKVRANSTPKERLPVAPSTTESNKRRLSFPLSQGIGSLFSYKGSSSSRKALDRHQSVQSIGNRSVDSTVSMPATVGRKPFNRFV